MVRIVIIRTVVCCVAKDESVEAVSPKNSGNARGGLLPEALWAELQKSASIREYAPGDVIVDAGDQSADLLKITTGHVKLMLVDEGGSSETVEVLDKGAVFGESALTRGAVSMTRAVALSRVRLLCLPGAAIHRQLANDPENALATLAIISANLRRLLQQVTELKLKNTAQRLGMLLLSLSDQNEGAATIKLPYRKQDVADKLAMSPETLSRSFAKLEKADIRTEGHRVVHIGDIAKLAEFCGIDWGDLENVK